MKNQVHYPPPAPLSPRQLSGIAFPPSACGTPLYWVRGTATSAQEETVTQRVLFVEVRLSSPCSEGHKRKRCDTGTKTMSSSHLTKTTDNNSSVLTATRGIRKLALHLQSVTLQNLSEWDMGKGKLFQAAKWPSLKRLIKPQ